MSVESSDLCVCGHPKDFHRYCQEDECPCGLYRPATGYEAEIRERIGSIVGRVKDTGMSIGQMQCLQDDIERLVKDVTEACRPRPDGLSEEVYHLRNGLGELAARVARLENQVQRMDRST